MKKILFFLASFLAGIGLFLWVGKTVGWQEVKNALLVFTGLQGLVILALTVLIKAAEILKWKVILRSQGHDVSTLEITRIHLASRLIAFIAPTLILADEIFMGYTLKERNFVPWVKGAASIIIYKILYLTGIFIIVSSGLIFLLLKIGLPVEILGIILGSLLFSLIVVSIFYFKCFKKESLMKSIVKALSRKPINQKNKVMEIEREVFSFFGLKEKSMWFGFGLTFFEVMFHFLRCWVLMVFLVKDIGALPTLSIFSFFYLSSIIPIPAALGSHEALQIFAFNSLGLKISTATAFTMIIRGADAIMALIGGFFLFQLGIGLLKISLLRKIEAFFSNNKDN